MSEIVDMTSLDLEEVLSDDLKYRLLVACRPFSKWGVFTTAATDASLAVIEAGKHFL